MIGGDFVGVLAAANEGDASSFDLLWRDLNPALIRYLRVMVGDDAESILAQTWSDITLGMGSFRGDEASWRAWTFGIARRRALTAGRRWFALPHAPTAGPANPTRAMSPETTLQDVVTTVALELVAALPRLQAEVLLLRAAGELSIDETARLLQRSRRAVRAAGYHGAANVGAAGLWLDHRAAEATATTARTPSAAPTAPVAVTSLVTSAVARDRREGERWFEALLAGSPVAAEVPAEVLRLADVIRALAAPASGTELSGSGPAYVAYHRHVVARDDARHVPSARIRGSVAARTALVGVAFTALGLGATTVAAFAGVLPAPLQDVAHHLINAPSSSSSVDSSDTPQPPASGPATASLPADGTRPGGSAGTGHRHAGQPSAKPTTAGGGPNPAPSPGGPSAPATATPSPTPSDGSGTPTSAPSPSTTPTSKHGKPSTSHGDKPPTPPGKPSTTPGHRR